MNIILFTPEEINVPLPLNDARAIHIKKILKLSSGESFDAGVINTGTGKALINSIDTREIIFTFTYTARSIKRNPVILLTAVTRPPEAKKILKNSATIGITALFLAVLEKSEKSYMDSSLWKKENYKNYLIEGASQAFAADIPEVRLFQSFSECLKNIPDKYTVRAALDNYEAEKPLGALQFRETDKKDKNHIVLAVGGERGWSAKERQTLYDYGFNLYSIGERVLKTETACAAGLAIILSKTGLM